MSAKSASLTPPTNLAEVMERILSLEGLQRQRRDDLMSALRQIARLIGGLPADIPADPEALKRGLKFLTPAAANMTKSRWGNVRALLAAALDLTGAKISRQRRKVELKPSWTSLWNRVGNKYRFGEGRPARSSQQPDGRRFRRDPEAQFAAPGRVEDHSRPLP